MTEENKIEKKLRECEKKLGEMARLKLVEQSVIAGLREEGFSEKALELFRYRKNFLIGGPEEYEADVVGSFTGSCGDRVDIYLKIEENVIKDAKYTTNGCPGAVTSASAVTLLLIGKRIDEAKNLNIKSVIEYLKKGQKSLPKHMYDCCGIPIGSLKDAVSKYETKKRGN
jgi:nitrogen fixation NifU-like protein